MNPVFSAIVLTALLAPCIGLAGGSPARTGPFVQITLADLNDTAPANAAIRVRGTVVDAYPDETDDDYVFLLLRDGEAYAYVGAKVPSGCYADRIVPLIGAEIEVRGMIQDYVTQKRVHAGRLIVILGLDKITVLSPAPDPFLAPELTALANVPPDTIACLGRRRTYGEVIARWEPHEFLIRTKRRHMDATNMVMRIDAIGGTMPVPGQVVEVSGFPETDLYRINLTRARWRPSNTPPFPPETAVRLTARDIVVGKDRARGFDYTLHGHLVRMTGKVLSLPSGLSSDRFLSLDNGGITVNVDVSALAGGAEDAQIGATAEVTGVCVFDIDNWRPNAAFPQIKGFRIVPRGKGDIRVLAAPPWWTPVRVWSVLGSLAVLLVAIFIWNVSLRRLADRRGRALAAESVSRAESDLKFFERTRLAVELHDSIAQYMTGAAMEVRAAIQAHAAKDPKTADHLHVALQAINSSRGELRNCIWDLRNNALESSDPNDAIALALAPHLGETKLTVRFNVPRERFSDNAMHAIICIVRELTINAIRHGGATEVRIAGAIEDGKLLCSVRDNGCGFKPEEAPGMEQGHFGLQGIRERLKERRGTLTLESAPGAGTKATLSIELPKTTSHE